MQSVAETVGLDPETASRVQVLTGVRAARQTRPPSAEPPVRRGRTIAFASGALVAAAAVAIGLGIMSARRGDADPVDPAPQPAAPEPVAAQVMPPPAPTPAPPTVVEEEPAPEPAPVPDPSPPEPAGPARPEKKVTSKATGMLDLNAVPWAYVSINGGPEEETPIKARKLPAGKHKVLIRNPVLERHREMTIEITPGETSKHVVDLRQ